MAAGRVERATRADLRQLGVSTQDSSLAAAALELAVRMDTASNDAAVAALARELRCVMGTLSQRATPRSVTTDAVDEVRRKRDARRTGT